MIFTGLAAAPRLLRGMLMEGNGRRGREVGNAGEELVRWCRGRGEPLDARGEDVDGLEEMGG